MLVVESKPKECISSKKQLLLGRESRSDRLSEVSSCKSILSDRPECFRISEVLFYNPFLKGILGNDKQRNGTYTNEVEVAKFSLPYAKYRRTQILLSRGKTDSTLSLKGA
ncbi:hypothetical protein TNCT_241961 [Trichonephila clavata]|uniref:Uncharacterized protein n=1 Tax=Trichonephila clavata TaxID=2740835 RepID=A0A8X6LI18_TRICU|nr:hypothetical protein TNCT_241961 [Trichonephila clavata]